MGSDYGSAQLSCQINFTRLPLPGGGYKELPPETEIFEESAAEELINYINKISPVRNALKDMRLRRNIDAAGPHVSGSE